MLSAGHIQSFNYTTDDIFWGQLGGCLESINGGVTTVVDHADMTYSPEHGEFLQLASNTVQKKGSHAVQYMKLSGPRPHPESAPFFVTPRSGG
jgi:hypothetical protein